jgi:hypothetical protein
MSEDKIWTCFYCGSLMDDVRAVRVIKDLPYKQRIHACVACDATVGLTRSKTLHGRQEHVKKVFGDEDGQITLVLFPNSPEHRMRRFVDRSGVPCFKKSEV